MSIFEAVKQSVTTRQAAERYGIRVERNGMCRCPFHDETLVVALGAGLGIWGVINLLEGYGQDNPASKSQGMKQLMAGGGVALIGITLVPLLSGLFG